MENTTEILKKNLKRNILKGKTLSQMSNARSMITYRKNQGHLLEEDAVELYKFYEHKLLDVAKEHISATIKPKSLNGLSGKLKSKFIYKPEYMLQLKDLIREKRKELK